MRVKIRFNPESCQAPIIIDVRFLPRIGERLEIGFRKMIEVLDVRRIDNDNRFSGIIHANFIAMERKAPPAPAPRPMPLPPIPLPLTSMAPAPQAFAPRPVMAADVAPAGAAGYGNMSLSDLAAFKQAVASAESTP